MFSRSHALLRSSHHNTGETINLILRHFTKTLKLCKSLNKSNVAENVHTDENIVHLSQQANEQNPDQITNSVTNNLEKLVENNVTFVEKNEFELDDALYDEPVKLPQPLDVCDEDISYIGPYTTPTYSFAKYANKSRTIQEMVKLGVALYRMERQKDVLEMFLRLDFEKDIKPYIQFLNDCGVPPDQLGVFITKNPRIFKQDMDDLRTRIVYLKAHKFTTQAISNIVRRNPFWLSHSTRKIDEKLGYFQKNFMLRGFEIRKVATKCPILITKAEEHIRGNTFAVKEEMGFDKHESKMLLLKEPSLWTKYRPKIVNTFDYAHNQMKLSHLTLIEHSAVLLCRPYRLQYRHKFLVELKRDQFDPSKPMYVSPTAVVSGDDNEFCRNVAKTSIEVYNNFLKSF